MTNKLRVLVVVNDAEDIKANSTTADLIRLGRGEGWSVHTAGVQDFSLRPDGQGWVSPFERAGGRTSMPLTGYDLVLSRTNPARDAARSMAHRFAMRLLTDAVEAGTDVINDPRGLARADSKAFLMDFDESVRPAMLVSQRADEILSYAHSLGGDAVVKPAHGTHGSGVIALKVGESDHRERLDELLTRGPLIVQPFLSAAVHGDTRVIVVDGDLLEVDGNVCAVRRLPAAGDFRSNVAAGGKPARATVTDGMRAVVTALGPKLRELGLWLVGLDFVGNQIIEANAYSPGGLADASAFEDRDFGGEIFARLAQRVTQRDTEREST